MTETDREIEERIVRERTDLVGTCPKDFWLEWIAEGDAAGEPYSGEEWGWSTRSRTAKLIVPGDRFYVVAWGRLRGYAIVTRIGDFGTDWCICRRGGAIACTIDEPIPGFRGLLTRWWPREAEKPFPDWRTAGIGVEVAAAKPRRQAELFG